MTESRRPSILTLDLSDRNSLYRAWMSFVEGGGIFVPTNREYSLGEEAFVRVDMPDKSSKAVAGKVVWLSPRGVVRPREQGIGIQISKSDRGQLQRQAERLLAGSLGADKPTQTV
ncbi:MAG: PilZ domain-containing protein [Gammaproteobacteria bacterium]|nr:PilZ domain-containing protein [Gammaproteobacteria bacterium]